ncbi:MAG: hypothetical protein WCA38_03500 [Candidatus Acidiferrales bacterium]
MAALRFTAVIAAAVLYLSSAPSRNEQELRRAELLALHRTGSQGALRPTLDSSSGIYLCARWPNTDAIAGRHAPALYAVLSGAEFTAWDDLEPPIVHVSPDGQMGWMIVRMKIAVNRADASGKKTTESTVMVWMSTYEKHDGKWQHVTNASTVEQ